MYLCTENDDKMKFEIKELTGFSGQKAHIYSVILEGDNLTLLEQFFNENREHPHEIKEIFNRILLMGNETGCRRTFFKPNEGKPGDGVAALKEGDIRLYCLYFDNTAVFFGNGGYKGVRAHQDRKELHEKVTQMEEIAKKINNAIKERDIIIEEDGSLTINYWDYEE